MEKTIHQGRNIKRSREMLGIKQEGLALELGEDWNQRKISLLEQKETIEPELLEQVAKVLKVPVEAIKNFDEQAAIQIVSNSFQDRKDWINYHPGFHINLFEKWIEALEEIKKLNEALLKEKDEKIALLKSMITRKKK
jgi:transcriptional regulator with XRE-family HTH domain